MSPIRPRFCALALGLALGACATPPDEAAAPPPADADAEAPVFAETPPPPPMDESATPEEPVMTCDASKAQWAIGEIADEALVARAKADTGSERSRVIPPGMAVTMDYREDRLNLDVDAENRVTAVRCG